LEWAYRWQNPVLENGSRSGFGFKSGQGGLVLGRTSWASHVHDHHLLWSVLTVLKLLINFFVFLFFLLCLDCILFLFWFSGDLWSGSEGGVIKIWPWEALEKAFSLTAEERHMAALLVERSFIDLRNQVTANGFSNVLNSDVKHLLSDNSTAKVWSAGFLSFALWYVLFCGYLTRV